MTLRRRFLSAALASLVLVAGCSEGARSPLAPEAGPAQSLSADVDLSSILQFATLPDLSGTRRVEKRIRAAEGGSVELNGFRVDIPAGALPSDTVVTIDLPSTADLAGHVVAEFGPHGIQFNTPVTLSLPLTGVILSGSPIQVARWENGGWTPLGGTVNAAGTVLSSTTPHFSMYGGHVMAGG